MAGGGVSAAPPEGTRRRGRILVVDDEPMLVRLFTRVLGAEHDVVGESNAQAALDRIVAGERFDVVICDLLMPILSGMALYDAIERIDAGQARRMVFLSGDTGSPQAAEFFSRVHNPRVLKPVVPSELRELVRGLLTS